MSRFGSPWTFFRRKRGKGPGWDVHLPAMGMIFLFLDVSPRPIFGLNLESARVLLQFPLLGAVFIAAWERRFLTAVFLGGALGALQSWPGLRSLVHDGFSFEGQFPAFAWSLLLLGYLHPARRGVYLGSEHAKEPTP